MGGAKKILLIDANNLAYRAFYALPETISTTSGTVTNAVYGFTSMLIKLIEEQKPQTIICAFDSKVPTFRHKLFEEYKIQRKKMPSELVNQMPLIKEVLDSFNILSLEIDGYEADDVLASIARLLSKRFEEIIIVTGDKDILQLISRKIKVMAVKKGITDTIIYDEEKVKEKFGVGPQKIKDLLALMGDSSDNIPGIPGIGPKIARKLLEEYKSLDNIYRNIDKVKSEGIRNLLIKYKNQVEISKKLVQLDPKLEIDIDKLLSSRSFKDLDYRKIEKLFDSLEFKTLKERIRKLDLFKGPVSQKEYRGEIENSYNKTKFKVKLKKMNLRFLLSDLDFENLYRSLDESIDNKLYLSLVWLKNPVKDTDSSKLGNNFCKGAIKGAILYPDYYPNYPGAGGSVSTFNAYFISDETLNNTITREKIKRLIEDKKLAKSGFDFKSIYKFFKKYGIDLDGRIIDYKIVYLLLNPFAVDVSLEEVLKSYLGLSLEELKSFPLKELEESKELDNQLSKENQLQLDLDRDLYTTERNLDNTILIADDTYNNLNNNLNNNLDADFSEENLEFPPGFIVLYGELENKLLKSLKEEGLDKLYFDIEGPLVRVLAKMEFRGVNVDKAYLDSLIYEYEVNIKKLEGEIYNLCGQEFNINSPQQLSNILYRKLGLPVVKKTKTGLSTDAGTLISICDKHPVVEKILDYREKVKLKNTYIDVLPGLIDLEDGRIHTTYNQLGTSTGRISSVKPNLQNIPIRTELGKEIRKAFIPGEGYDLLMSADYSQIELRVLAHFSEDENLIEAFNRGEDIHTRTASEIFGINYEDVDESLRRKAKAINFGIIYGMTEYGLGSRLSISEDEAREYIRMYFEKYPKVKKYIDYLIELAYERGYTTTLFGRKRYITELGSSNAKLRNLGERLAVNTPIQGSAADIMKLSTVVLFDSLKSKNIDCNIILHVHDELVLELKEKDLEEVKKIVKDSMENCVKLRVKLRVDIKTGRNWYI